MIHCSNPLLSTAMGSCQLSTVNCQLMNQAPSSQPSPQQVVTIDNLSRTDKTRNLSPNTVFRITHFALFHFVNYP